MSLNAFAAAVVVPPLALAPITLAGALLGWRYRRTGLAVATIGAALLVLLAMPAIAGALLFSLEQGLPLTAPEDDPPHAIVILAADASHPVGAGSIGLGPFTLERVAAGAALYRSTHLPILVTGGRPDEDDTASFAELMARVLVHDFGVPVRWEETSSTNTWQNAALSAPILAAAGIRSIYLVTHAWHMRRAIFCFRHFGITVTAAPVRLDRRPRLTLGAFAPGLHGWQESYDALHEWIGIAWYRLRY